MQAVLNLATAHQERVRLLQAMGFASALGLLFAALLGVLIGRRAVRPLAQALTLQRAFVADAGHELRTPLTLLSTRAQVLDRTLRRNSSSDEILRDSDGVVEDTKRLGEVVDDLLAAADPRGAEGHEPVDLAQIAAEVADSAGAHAEQAGVGCGGMRTRATCWSSARPARSAARPSRWSTTRSTTHRPTARCGSPYGGIGGT